VEICKRKKSHKNVANLGIKNISTGGEIWNYRIDGKEESSANTTCSFRRNVRLCWIAFSCISTKIF
jgi:hypothetical protein